MSILKRSVGWGGLLLLAAGLHTAPVLAQTSLDLSTAGVTWKVKDVGTDSSNLDPSKKDFTGATEANGWTDAEVPGDLFASEQVAEFSNFWLRADGIRIPSDWPRDRYLVLSGFNVEDSDQTFFNGTLIGAHTGGADIRSYIVPPEIVDFTGDNVLAILGNNATANAGITGTAPVLDPGASDTGVLVINALNTTRNLPAKDVLVVAKNADGVDTDYLTNSGGQIVLTDLAPGAFPVQITSYPWVGSVSPSGTQTQTIQAGKVTKLDLRVDPFVYSVLKTPTPITIDGNIDGPEWEGAQAMGVDQRRQLAAGGTTVWRGLEDLSGTAKWKWDDTYIYLAANVVDDTRVNQRVADPADWGNLWQGDGFETYIQLDPYDPRRSAYRIDRNYQWTIGVDPEGVVGWKIFRATSTPNDVLPPDIPEPAEHSKVVKTPKGYILEARFPWASLPDVNQELIPPKVGTQGAIALAINDTDNDVNTRDQQASWNTRGDMWNNPSSFTRAIWADATASLQIGVGSRQSVPANDVNKDGAHDLKDTTMILQIAVGLLPPPA